MQVWGIETVQAPSLAYEDFNYDIVAQFKVSYRGAPAIKDPRFWSRSDA